MKPLLKKIFGNIIDGYFFNFTRKAISSLPEGSKIFFFDIDNTIADTKGRRHLTGVSEFPKMISLVKASAREGKVFFLSARNILTFRTTSLWLKERGLPEGDYRLIFLTEPNRKPVVLKMAIQKNLDVIYFDDLCYNHEHGAIKKYDELIREIQELNITYKGIEDFKHLQQIHV